MVLRLILSVFLLQVSLSGMGASEVFEPVEPVESGLAEANGGERIYVEMDDPGEDALSVLQVSYDEMCPGDGSVTFVCSLGSAPGAEKALMRLRLVGQDGTVVHEADSVVGTGEAPCVFSWSGQFLEAGVYRVCVEVVASKGMPVATRHFTLRKLAKAQVAGDVETASQTAAELAEHLDTLDWAEAGASYAAVRTVIARESAQRAQEAFEAGDWRRAEALARYSRGAVDSIRARLTFGNDAEELKGAVPAPDLSTLAVRDGGLYAAGRPVFLFGMNLPSSEPASLARLRECGLNMVSVEATPADAATAGGSTDGPTERLDALFKDAKTNNMSVMYSIAPHVLSARMASAAAESGDGNTGSFGFEITGRAARAAIERYVRATATSLAGHDMLCSVCLLDKPIFRLRGEEIRAGFIRFVESAYEDRYELNTMWKTKLASFDEIDVDMGIEQAAYQYDWQTYHMQLCTEFVDWLHDLVRDTLPTTPLHLRFAGDILEPAATEDGIEHERLAAALDVVACSVSGSAHDPYYAMAYPKLPLIVTLMRSLAPNKPVFNSDYVFFEDGLPEMAHAAASVHSVMWEAAMSGLTASAVHSWGPTTSGQGASEGLWNSPACLDGYATACLDLNRLADVVTAFQRAPAEVAVLWSLPSRIRHNGEPYLASVTAAFEGASFSGRNVRFITEGQCAAGELSDVQVLVIPQAEAVEESAFAAINQYIADGGIVVRVGTPLFYNERGYSRQTVIANSLQTLLIRGRDTSTQYLHAMDGVESLGRLTPILRAINPYGYPLEGVKTRYLAQEGREYLYVVNLRKEPVTCYLSCGARTGRDLIQGRDVAFPANLPPLDPMLISLDPPDTASAGEAP